MSKLFTYYKSGQIEAGCDEAGRGCVAGPVVAASVILPENFKCSILNDSKKISKQKREYLKEKIESEALSWAVSFIDHIEIDRINILKASILAMQNSVEKLKIIPELLLIDGNKFSAYKIPHVCIIKGDSKYMSIAAASILAKTHRDAFMVELDAKFPMYQWINNKGYPTKEHCLAIEKHGYSEFHRKTFHIKSLSQLSLDI